MAFTDLMTSARGPGVIGTILGLVVLLGFGLLFLFAFDDGLQGGDQTIESVLRNQEREIDSLSERLAYGAARLMDGERRRRLLGELSQARGLIEKKAAEIAWLEEREIAMADEMVAIGREFETYRDHYRNHIRAAATGTKMERLTTLKGEVYDQVTIRQVNAIGIQIAHHDGFKRIPFEDLPEEMQDYYQFCPDQRQQALRSESEHRVQHERLAANARNAAEQARLNEQAREQAMERERNIRLLQITETRIRSLDNEIRALQRAIEMESRKTLSRAPQMRTQLAQKERERANLQSQAERLREGQ